MPSASLPYGRNGVIGDLRDSLPFSPAVGGMITWHYRPPSSLLFIGGDLGYLYSALYDYREAWTGNLSILMAGFNAGLHVEILPGFGLRGFGSAGYSYWLVHPRQTDDNFYSFLRFDNSTAEGGTPFVGAGGELSWALFPGLGLVGGVRYRHFFDLHDELVVSLGMFCNLLVGGREAARPVRREVAPLPARDMPLKNRSKPLSSTGQDARVLRISQSLMPQDPAVVILSDQIRSSDLPKDPTIDASLQRAMAAYEALRRLDIACIEEEPTPSPLGKPPAQTLRDHGGSDSDICILYCSLLEALHVETAVITIPGHIFAAFSVVSGSEVQSSGRDGELVFRNGKMWVPLEINDRAASFHSAWQAGALKWRTSRKQAHIHPLEQARGGVE